MSNLASALDFDSEELSSPSTTSTTMGEEATAVTTMVATTTKHYDDKEEYYKSLGPSKGQTWVIISIGVVSSCVHAISFFFNLQIKSHLYLLCKRSLLCYVVTYGWPLKQVF